MIRIYPWQLTAQLANKLHTCYLIIGNDILLAQESKNEICQSAKLHGFTECYNFYIDTYSTHTHWKSIYQLSSSFSLFSNRQIIILTISEIKFTTVISDNLLKLATLLHQDLILVLVIRCNKLTSIQENSEWYKKIARNCVSIKCLTPEPSKLDQWITQRAKKMSLNLDKYANQLLCYYYEGNLLSLTQVFHQLLLLHPDGNITLPRIKEVLINSVKFTPYQFVDALLTGEIVRSLQVLKTLQQEDYEPLILLKLIQHEIILLLQLQFKKKDHKSVREFLDKNKIWPNRWNLILNALHRLSLIELQLAIKLIYQSELCLKQNYGRTFWFWSKLEILSMILCGRTLPRVFIDETTD